MKYVRRTEAGETDEWMFDLSKDPGEERNLIAGDHAGPLKQLLTEWENDVVPVR